MSHRFALMLGAMKTGTTALYGALARHPDVLPSREKEPAYWIQDSARGKGLAPYLKLWDPAAKPAARWWLEASTGYTKIPVRCSPAALLRNVDAEFRFIYVVRNPVDRVRSHYEHALAEGWMRGPIHEGLDPTAVWFSNYHVQLQPYVDCFGRDSIHVLSHEELCASPGEVLEGVCRFLEIDPRAIPPELPRMNTSGHHRARRLAAARQRAAAEGRHPTDLELEAELQRAVTPTPEVVAALHRALDDDLARFERDFGLDPWTGQRVGAALSAA